MTSRDQSEPTTSAATPDGLGRRAERFIGDLLRSALPAEYVLLPNVAWLVRRHGAEREGEADLVIAHPDKGFLIVEVQAGPIIQDSLGRWWAGGRALDRPPFQQAADSHHSLVAKLAELPAWPEGLDPIVGHAVAFPNAELASLGVKILQLGPDADPELILDKSYLAPDPGRGDRLREWVDRCFELWEGGSRRPPGPEGVELLAATVTSPLELRSLHGSEVAPDDREVVRLTEGQLRTLNLLRGVRRATVVGGAGTGKTMLAIAKASQLADEGFQTLLVCFNSGLARVLADETRAVTERTGRLDVTTFHQLAEDLGRAAGTLPPKPDPVTPEWLAETLPGCLDDAIGVLGPRYEAIVIDEGQDFDSGWLVSLEGLLHGGHDDVLFVFHDPGQAILRDDQTADLGLAEFPLDLNCRNPQPIHAMCAPLAKAGLAVKALRPDGRPPELIRADVDAEAIEALDMVLHRLVAEEGVAPGSIAVLTGLGLEKSAVWAHRRYGDQVLWNGSAGDDGHLLGLDAADVPEAPPDVVLCESIRRFRGLERPVVVLLEVPRDDPDRLDRLLYIGMSRAAQHLVLIAPLAVIRRVAPGTA
jgi:hypothetical protein